MLSAMEYLSEKFQIDLVINRRVNTYNPNYSYIHEPGQLVRCPQALPDIRRTFRTNIKQTKNIQGDEEK